MERGFEISHCLLYFHGIYNYFKSDCKYAWQYVDDGKAFLWELAVDGYNKDNGNNQQDMRLGVIFEATVKEALNKVPLIQQSDCGTFNYAILLNPEKYI